MHPRIRVALGIVTATCMVLAGCASTSDTATDGAGDVTAPMTAPDGPDAQQEPVPLVSMGVTMAPGCDALVPGECLLPFPSDGLSVADSTTPTGRRLALRREALPANVRGVHIDPADQNRADGFSPGSALLVDLGPLDLAASKAPSIARIAASIEQESPIVVLDATDNARIPFWAELDAQPDDGGAGWLMIHPAVSYPEGHRIVVGIRSMVAPGGAAVDASPAFNAYRSGQRTTDIDFEARRADMESVFDSLAGQGVERSTLQLAWSFTVASQVSLSSRLLSMRDDAFGRLATASPRYSVDKPVDDPEPRIARQIDGTFESPLYLTEGGAPGGRLVFDESGTPVRQPGVFTARFRCILPPASKTSPARMSLYGHGLLGSLDEVNSDMVVDMSNNHNVAYCATDLAGMSEFDLGNAVNALGDMSNFASIPDRLQQGFISVMFLGRLMTNRAGFAADAAFQFNGTSALADGELFYDGNSQGAIVGGAISSVSPDITRIVLGEAGMNYSLLLDRSVDFDEYLAAAFAPAYLSRTDRILAIALAQLLWDRGETTGYLQHLVSDQFPGTKPHRLLLLGAVGDHQVTEYSLRVEARTAKIPARVPLATPGRTAETEPAWAMETTDTFPFTGSGYVLSDTGSPPSPPGNVPPRDGHDPHDDTPNIPQIQLLKDAFWGGSSDVSDICPAGSACVFEIPATNR